MNGQKLTKYNFAPILANIITTSMKTESISNGFKHTGLVPFGPNQVDYSKVEVLSSVNKLKQTVIPNLHVSDAQSSLNFMESFINPATLNEFKLTFSKFTHVWNGPEPAHDLYVAWKRQRILFCLARKLTVYCLSQELMRHQKH